MSGIISSTGENRLVGPAAVTPHQDPVSGNKEEAFAFGGNSERLHRLGTYLLISEKVEQVVNSYLWTHSGTGQISSERLTDIICKSLSFTRELANYYLHIRKYPPNIVVFGGVKLDEETHPKEFAEVEDLCRLSVRNGVGVKSGHGPGAMKASLKGGFEEYRDNPACRKFFEHGYATVGHKINMSREMMQEPNEYAHVSAFYDHFPIRKLALMGPDSVACFVVQGGFGTIEEAVEWLVFAARRYIPDRPIYLVGKEFWEPVLAALKDLAGENSSISAMVNRIAVIEKSDFEATIGKVASSAQKLRAEWKTASPQREFADLIGRKYTARYNWLQSGRAEHSYKEVLSREQHGRVKAQFEKMAVMLNGESYSADLMDNLAKVFADHFYSQTVFAQFDNVKPVTLCGSRKRFGQLFDRVIGMIHEIAPNVPVITRTANYEVGITVHGRTVNGKETSWDYPMRTSLCGWPNVLTSSRAIVNLSGGGDTVWGALTAVVAEQTNKPEMDCHPPKFIFDPDGRVERFFRTISAHVTDPRYQYAKPAHANILQYVHAPNGNLDMGLGFLREQLAPILAP